MSPEVPVPIVIALPSASIASRVIVPTLSILPSEASKLPADILLLPTSIAPKPDVIEPEFKAPTDVAEVVTTVDLSAVPVKVPAAAVTVIAAEPSKLVPLIALAVVSVAAEPVVFWLSVGNVQLVKAPEAGVPKTGVVRVGEVKVLFVNVCVEVF